VEAKRPHDCADDEIEAFRALVAAGGEVVVDGLEGRVRNAALLSFMWRGAELIGVAGLKHPSAHHRREVSDYSGVALPIADVPLELGWVYVQPKHKGGKSMPLCAALVERTGEHGIFATSRDNNPAMHRTLGKLQFERRGGEWASGLNPAKLWLFVRKAAPPKLGS
jgi:hypothetical protein